MQLDVPAAPAGPPVPDLRIDRLDREAIGAIRQLNVAVFGDERVIYRLDRDDLLLLLAYAGDEPIGYKVGYRESESTFYSAKGGVLEGWRRRGVAKALLGRMEAEARAMGYRRLAFDTFPNRHPGMTVMGLREGFTVTAAGYNAAYRDYRIRFEREL